MTIRSMPTTPAYRSGWDATFGRGREEACERCNGSGVTSAPYETDAEDCPVCHGTGKRPAGEEDGR